MILADLETVDKRYAKVVRAARGSDKLAKAELLVLDKIKPTLEAGQSVRSISFTDEEEKLVKGLFLLTSKPVLYVANLAEDDMADPESSRYFNDIKAFAATEKADVIGLSASAEEDIAQLAEEDKAEFLEMAGVTEPGLNKLIRAAYHLLDLRTFFTAGGKETRAWTFKSGMKAPQTAGVIHSDFERGFIRAETIAFDDLNTFGSVKAVKEAGKLRSEGKEYVVNDGDIIEFRFNV